MKAIAYLTPGTEEVLQDVVLPRPEPGSRNLLVEVRAISSTRSLYQTSDMAEQGRILNAVARMVDAGAVRSTMTANLGAITAVNVQKTHRLIESGTTVGNLVLAGF